MSYAGLHPPYHILRLRGNSNLRLDPNLRLVSCCRSRISALQRPRKREAVMLSEFVSGFEAIRARKCSNRRCRLPRAFLSAAAH